MNSMRRESTGNINPAAGKEHAVVNVTIENDSSTAGEGISSLLMLELVDKDGMSMDWAIGAKTDPLLDTAFQGTFKCRQLMQGDKITGEVGYEVPQGATGLVLRFKPDPVLDDKSMVEVNLNQ